MDSTIYNAYRSSNENAFKASKANPKQEGNPTIVNKSEFDLRDYTCIDMNNKEHMEAVGRLTRGEVPLNFTYDGEVFGFYMSNKWEGHVLSGREARELAEKYDFDNMDKSDWMKLYIELADLGVISGMESYFLSMNDDRGTVESLEELIEHYEKKQSDLLFADSKLPPLGLSSGALLRDYERFPKVIESLNAILDARQF